MIRKVYLDNAATIPAESRFCGELLLFLFITGAK